MYKENPSKTNKHIRFVEKYLFAWKFFLKEKCNKYHGSYISKVDMIDPHVLLCQYNTEDILLKRMIVSHLDTWSFSGYFVFQ